MRIKKTSQTTTLPAQVVNTYSESTEDTYSCDYINNITGTPIWINLYGNSTFQPKEITGDFSQYSKFEIYAFVDTNGSVITHGTATKGTTKNIVYTSAYSRNFTITDTKITIAEGKYNSTTNNSAIIPAFIIGYK